MILNFLTIQFVSCVMYTYKSIRIMYSQSQAGLYWGIFNYLKNLINKILEKPELGWINLDSV